MIPPGFTGGTLDRADHLRNDPDALAAAVSDPEARLLVLDGLMPSAERERLQWTGVDQAPSGAILILLGLDGQSRPHFAAHAPGLAPDSAPTMRSPELMAALAGLAPGEAATYAAARSVILWHARHGFCGNCGSASTPFRAGWGRRCESCGSEHFPRVDPVVIMLAEHDGSCLLGRGPDWPAGRYSALAGFVEPGESIEEAVAREVFEEAGVGVAGVRYVASQPWPFASSLMIACIAVATSDTITLAREELAEAIWATRHEVRDALAGAEGARFGTPPAYAIAHTLLREWANA